MKNEPVIRLIGVRKEFADLEVLKGIDLSIGQSQAVVLIGSSGSGKSTLLRCMNMLERPTAGRILFQGTDLVTTKSLRQIRRRIGMVFQSFNLYPHMTARGNVALALRKVLKMSRADADAAAQEALAKVGLSDKGDNYPSELSGGQQQRVGIARSMVLNPELILFDEPTSALDPELVSEVLDVMAGLRDAGMNMVIVTHEFRFAESIADKVVVMDAGRIVEEGTAQQIFRDPQHERTQRLMRSRHH